MSDAQPLLDRILEAPDADEPRLVYADWLIERSDPRGDFISTQIHLRGKLSPSARSELKARERALLDHHEENWAAPARAIADEHSFVRGFIARVKSQVERFLGGYQALLAKEPVRSVELSCSGPASIEALVESELLDRVPNLALRGDVGDDGARLLASCGGLKRIRNLNLGGSGLSAEGAVALAASPHLESLETLTLTGNEIGSEGLAALAASASLTSLRALYVARNEIDDEGLIQLARSKSMKTLVKLGLGGNQEISSEGCTALLESRHLKGLVTCELDNVYVDGEVAQKLAKRWGYGASSGYD